MINRPILFLLTLSLIGALPLARELQRDDLRVLPEPANEMMASYLEALVDRQFAAREERLAQLKTAEDWVKRAEEIRSAMVEWTQLPSEKTPLNARTTGRLERDDYVVEKVLFESRPGFYVSGNLYLPRNSIGRRPAILNVLGHNSTGKTSEEKQLRCIPQVKKGFVAFVIDGIGQGERRIEDYAIFGSMPGAVHRTIGAQAFLAGTHLFSFMVWDAIRAIDYLCSRPEVDPERIGITGTSGGGMMSTYILPFEPRIKVAVPACNPNTWTHRVAANLATDHEQVFFGAFPKGIDPRGDPLFAHVPKPLLINATSDDNLNPPRGVWELHSWLYRAYAANGHPEKLHTTMVRAPHDYNQEQREVTNAWMLRWLGDDISGSFLEGELPIEPESDLWCTETGDLYALDGSLTPHDLVKTYYSEHLPAVRVGASTAEVTELRREMAKDFEELIGFRLARTAPAVRELPQRETGGTRIKPFVLKPEEGIRLPAVWIESSVAKPGSLVLYLQEEGKESLLRDQEVVETLLGRGSRILAVDLRGTGETAPGKEGYFWDFLAGRPISGQRVGDVLSILSWVEEQGVDLKGVRVWGHGLAGIWAAMATLYSEPVGGMVLEGSLISFEDVILRQLPQYNHEILIPGIVKRFDLPDLYAALCPTSVTLLNPVLADKTPARSQDIEDDFSRTEQTYGNLGTESAFSVHTGVEGPTRVQIIIEKLLAN